jgi:hypothetical protein
MIIRLRHLRIVKMNHIAKFINITGDRQEPPYLTNTN